MFNQNSEDKTETPEKETPRRLYTNADDGSEDEARRSGEEVVDNPTEENFEESTEQITTNPENSIDLKDGNGAVVTDNPTEEDVEKGTAFYDWIQEFLRRQGNSSDEDVEERASDDDSYKFQQLRTHGGTSRKNDGQKNGKEKGKKRQREMQSSSSSESVERELPKKKKKKPSKSGKNKKSNKGSRR